MGRDVYIAIVRSFNGSQIAGVPVWQLCGTAKSHLDSIGPLLMGREGWHVAWRQSEWTGAANASQTHRKH